MVPDRIECLRKIQCNDMYIRVCDQELGKGVNNNTSLSSAEKFFHRIALHFISCLVLYCSDVRCITVCLAF